MILQNTKRLALGASAPGATCYPNSRGDSISMSTHEPQFDETVKGEELLIGFSAVHFSMTLLVVMFDAANSVCSPCGGYNSLRTPLRHSEPIAELAYNRWEWICGGGVISESRREPHEREFAIPPNGCAGYTGRGSSFCGAARI